MKKSIALVVCMTTVLMYGMNNEHDMTFFIKDTVVHLKKGCMCQADGMVDCIVVGRNEQRALKKPSFGDNHKVGTIEEVRDKIVYLKKKDSDSGSEDDVYKWFDNNDKNRWENAYTRELKTKVMNVIEPRITCSLINTFDYYAQRRISAYTDAPKYDCIEAEGEEAITEACLDLATCYANILREGLVKEKGRIASPALSTCVGLPRTNAGMGAVKAIFNYINENADDGGKPYGRIHLFVKKRSEFELYKSLLAAYAEQQ